MIAFQLDARSGVPTYLQLVQQVRHALLLGQLREGDRLPAVREVVEQLAINPNTVLKAYRELEHQGLAAPRAGLGTFVRDGVRVVPAEVQSVIRRGLARYVREGLAAGLEADDVLALLQGVLRELAAEGAA